MRATLPGLFFLAVASGCSFAITFTERPAQGMQWETAVFRFSENLGRENPFDCEMNRICLHIRQPDSTLAKLSFFYDGLSADSVEKWEARFSPKLPGTYTCSLFIDNRLRDQFILPVEASGKKRRGGLTRSKEPGCFRFESGEAFRGIGVNICWADDYEYYFRKMKDAGMNVTRIWLCPWNLPLEWSKTGLGRYDLKSAQRLDTILEKANRYGIYVLLCMDYHGVAQKEQGFFRENRWRENPYNRANGGPCVNPEDLFTDSTAESFARKKYAYIVSRYGFSPNIVAWEFYNEADLMAGKAVPINRWHVAMARYVRAIDSHHRMISTSGTRRFFEKLVDAFRDSSFDFVMYHDYNMLDVAPHLINIIEMGDEFYGKPVVIGEFGIEFRSGAMTAAEDPEHVGLHNGIWAGFFSATPILPMSWWWDSYIDKQDLWYLFGNLTRFTDSLDFNARPVAIGRLQADYQRQHPKSKVLCHAHMVRAGCRYAVWFKSGNYVWSAKSSGLKQVALNTFTQKVPGVTPGKYSVTWYNPQTGAFSETKRIAAVNKSGVLTLTVPSFAKDAACLIVPVK